MGRTSQRVLAVVVLVAAGILSLPLTAAVLDLIGPDRAGPVVDELVPAGPRTENWILPVQLVVMAAIGAAVTIALPAMARAGAPMRTRALTGLGWGLLAAMGGVLVFWLLLNGFRGA